MRKIVLFLIALSFVVCVSMSTVGCSKGGDGDGKGKVAEKKKPTASIVGTWKLVKREEGALPNLGILFAREGNLFDFQKKNKLVITRALLDGLKINQFFPTKKDSKEGPGLGEVKARGSYKLKSKSITIELPNLREPQQATVTTLTDTELVLTDDKKKSIKFKRKS